MAVAKKIKLARRRRIDGEGNIVHLLYDEGTGRAMFHKVHNDYRDIKIGNRGWNRRECSLTSVPSEKVSYDELSYIVVDAGEFDRLTKFTPEISAFRKANARLEGVRSKLGIEYKHFSKDVDIYKKTREDLSEIDYLLEKEELRLFEDLAGVPGEDAELFRQSSSFMGGLAGDREELIRELEELSEDWVKQLGRASSLFSKLWYYGRDGRANYGGPKVGPGAEEKKNLVFNYLSLLAQNVAINHFSGEDVISDFLELQK